MSIRQHKQRLYYRHTKATRHRGPALDASPRSLLDTLTFILSRARSLLALSAYVHGRGRPLVTVLKANTSSLSSFMCATDGSLTSQLAAAQCGTRPHETHFRLPQNLSGDLKRRRLSFRSSDRRLSGDNSRGETDTARQSSALEVAEEPQHGRVKSTRK